MGCRDLQETDSSFMTGMSGMSGLSGMVGASVAVWTPLTLDTNLRQYALDGGDAYEASTLGGLPVLRSLEPYGTYRQPRQGRCWLSDGTDDRAPLTTTISLTGAFTFAFQIRPTSNSVAVISGRAGNNNNSIVYNNASGNIVVETLTASSTAFTTALSTGAFQHIAIVRDGSNLVTVYKDGASVGSQTVTGTLEIGQLLARNTIVPSVFFPGRIRDIRIYNVAKDATAIANIYAGTDDTVGLIAQYPCNEESGLVGYDISGNGNHLTLTNITPLTFHATDTGVLMNRNNRDGYRLSGSVYIPKRLSDTLAADGNALTVTGQSPYPANVEVPCITGNGTDVFASFPGTAGLNGSQMAFGGWVYHNNTGSGFISKGVNFQWGLIRQVGRYTLRVGAGVAEINNLEYSIADTATWHHVVGVVNGTTWTIYYDGVAVATSTGKASPASTNSDLLQIGRFGTVWPLNGRVSGMGYWGRLLSDAEVLAWYNGTLPASPDFFAPLQDGPGSSNTNRDISILTTGDALSVASGALLNGTVSTIWGNRCPNAEDWCVKYGGDIAGGVFLPGQISGSLASDGTAKTLAAGKFGNPYSRINFNPFTAAELNGLGLETAYAVTTARQSVSPTDTKFRRTAADGDDRFFTTAAALTGTDKTNAEAYVT